MAKKGSGGDTVTQRSTSEPWAPAGDHLQGIMGQAAELYKTGQGPSYYPGTTWIPPTAQEMQGMGQMEGLAKAGNPLLGGVLGHAGQMLSGGGLSSEQRQWLSPLQGIASGQSSITVPGVGENNKYLMDTLDTAAGEASDSIGGMFSGSGRYGGGAHQGTVGREVGNIYSTGLRDQMNLDLDRRMQAEAGNIANQAGAANSLQGIFGQGNQLAQTYAGMAPQLDAMRYGDSQRLIDVGAAQRGELQGQLGDQIARWDAKQSHPWDMLDLYNKMVSGMGGMGGSRTSSETSPRGSPLAGILGGASAGSSLAGPWGALGGGLLGAFM